jgi:hypothetical protein
MSKFILNKVEGILEKEGISFSSVRLSTHCTTGQDELQYSANIESKTDFEGFNGRLFETHNQLLEELNTFIQENL